jgi:hypothetical protein
MPTIEQVLERETEDWMRIPGVVGTGLGLCDDRPCIKIFAAGAPGPIDAAIPDEVDGYPVVVESTGRFTPRDTL